MMEALWQQIVVFVLVAAAVGYLAAYFRRRSKRKASCANCPTFRTLDKQRGTQRR